MLCVEVRQHGLVDSTLEMINDFQYMQKRLSVLEISLWSSVTV